MEYRYSVYKSTNNKLERRYHIVISAVIPVLWGIQKDTLKKWVEILFLLSLIHTPHFRSSFCWKMSIIHVIHLWDFKVMIYSSTKLLHLELWSFIWCLLKSSVFELFLIFDSMHVTLYSTWCCNLLYVMCENVVNAFYPTIISILTLHKLVRLSVVDHL